ncbi:MAG: PIN domain-containing protein [Caldivirga sp.]|jgi:Predicted nucleic acid-binding protein, contains PIN domain|nr:MAG: twitching motility protein PilT [Caldivirga sp. MG_3]KUO89022.1 MAG: twitching motility protein PilT [Caldivirga sp. CIS_19]NAZ28087.1 PIN domain-containing protein [Caldivirga sp.]
MKQRVVVDTNVLVYATFEDMEHHEEAYDILLKYNVVIPYIVLYEFLGVLARLTKNISVIMIKLSELTEFEIIHEDLDVVRSGIVMMRDDNAPIDMMNDYVILSVAMLEGSLATYDRRLRNLASKRGVVVMP